MRGRTCSCALAALAVISLCIPAIAADNAPPVTTPSRSAMKALVHPFPIGPTDLLDRARPISGTITMFARPPREVNIVSAEFFIDGKSVGKSGEQPYKLEYETSALTKGEHVVKAVGVDAQGKELWSASAKATIGAPTEGIAPPPGGINVPAAPDNVPAQPKPTVNSSPTPARPTAAAPESAAMKLTRSYSSAEFGFSISYPQAWTAVDKTKDMTPKQLGSAWVVFGTEPLDKSSIVVNLKRTQLEAGTDVDVFARYNPYVKQWKRTAILGSSAFVTTDGKPENKRIIHRAIIIKDGCAWMLNCIDTTGKPAAESKKLFDSMIDTLSTVKPAQPVVTITEG